MVVWVMVCVILWGDFVCDVVCDGVFDVVCDVEGCGKVE